MIEPLNEKVGYLESAEEKLKSLLRANVKTIHF